jgi:hypothetical protein
MAVIVPKDSIPVLNDLNHVLKGVFTSYYPHGDSITPEHYRSELTALIDTHRRHAYFMIGYAQDDGTFVRGICSASDTGVVSYVKAVINPFERSITGVWYGDHNDQETTNWYRVVRRFGRNEVAEVAQTAGQKEIPGTRNVVDGVLRLNAVETLSFAALSVAAALHAGGALPQQRDEIRAGHETRYIYSPTKRFIGSDGMILRSASVLRRAIFDMKEEWVWDS